MRTSCGETNERTAAFIHGGVAVLYATMLAFHIISFLTHWRRRD